MMQQWHSACHIPCPSLGYNKPLYSNPKGNFLSLFSIATIHAVMLSSISLTAKKQNMKHNILAAVGISGMLLGCTLVPDVVHASINPPLVALGSRADFYFDSPPTFVYVPDLGYSVAVESPYDVLYYDNLYYLYDNGYWYNSSFYDGPWGVIMEDRLPPLMRGHRIPDIRRFRDIEYRKHDVQYWQNRDLHDRRSHRGVHINSDGGLFDGRGDGPGRNDGDGRSRGDRRGYGEGRGPGDSGRGGGDGRPSGDGRGGGGRGR